MNDDIYIELTVAIKAEARATNTILCSHSGVYKQCVNPRNMEITKRTLTSALYDAADIIKQIGGDEN